LILSEGEEERQLNLEYAEEQEKKNCIDRILKRKAEQITEEEFKLSAETEVEEET